MESAGAGIADETDADHLRRTRDGDRRAFTELRRGGSRQAFVQQQLDPLSAMGGFAS